MIPLLKTLTLCLLILGFSGVARIVEAADYTPGKFHNYTHASGAVAKDDYQYSVYVPKDYNPEKSYPLVVYLHG